MTAATSTTNKSFFGKRYATGLAGNKTLLILNTVLELLGLPLISLVLIITFAYENAYRPYDFEPEAYLMIGVISILISIFMGMVIAMYHFRYLYNKSVVDMNYSLPLSDNQRFCADYLSGLTCYIAPVIAAVILSFIILGIGSTFVDMSELWEMFPFIFKAGCIVLVGMILLYTISVLAITFAGSTFEASLSIVALNVMIPAAIACAWFAVTSSNGFGLVEDEILYKNIFRCTTPIGAVFFFGMFIEEGTRIYSPLYGTDFINAAYTRWMIITFIVIAAYIVMAWLLYKRRKAEDVSKPYVYKAFYYIIMTLAVFCILSLFTRIDNSEIVGVIICAIGWFIMEVIRRRGFKKFWTAGVSFAAAVICSYAVIFLCDVTNGFGAPKYVPAKSSVTSVSINFNSHILLDYAEITTSDKDVIEKAIALQQEQIDMCFNSVTTPHATVPFSDGALFDNAYVSLMYSTVYGSTIERQYSVSSQQVADLTQAVLLSDEYATQTADRLALQIFNTNTTNLYYQNLDIALTESKNKKIDIYYSGKLLNDARSVRTTAEKCIELRDAYKEDMMSLTPELLESSKIALYLNDTWVLDSFQRTLSVLAEIGIEPEPITAETIEGINESESPIKVTIDPLILTYARYVTADDENMAVDSYEYNSEYDHYNAATYWECDAITTTNYDYRYYDESEVWDVDSVNAYAAELAELINNSSPVILGKKPTCALLINDYVIYLTEDVSSLTAEN